MKKLFLFAFILMISSTMLFSQEKEETKTWKLPQPELGGGIPLLEAFQHRASTREYSDRMLDDQHLSSLLWAANGINRKENGKRTAPSARNCQEIDIYVYTEAGVYLYVPEQNLLELKVVGDHRDEAAMQPFAVKCPLLLVFVANYDKMAGMDKEGKEFYGATDAGFVSENVYLYCASENLGTVVLGSIHRDKIKKLLGFNGKAILGQPVGYIE